LGFCGSFRRLCKLNAAEYRWGSEWESGLLPKMMSFIAARQLSLLIHTVFLQQLIAFDMGFSTNWLAKRLHFDLSSPPTFCHPKSVQ